MESFKNVLAVLAGVVGVLTSVLTLYAKFLDVKKDDSSKAKSEDDPKLVVPLEPVSSNSARPEGPNAVNDWYTAPAARSALRFDDLSVIEQARQAVKAPAIGLIVAGLLSLLMNLTVLGYGFVDQFVSPLSPESKARQESLQMNRGMSPSLAIGMPSRPTETIPDEMNAVLTIFCCACLALASVVAIWAGFGMLRLRGYWFSVVGSIAIMPAAILCCMGGFPIGVWSLVTLFRPEVSSSFR